MPYAVGALNVQDREIRGVLLDPRRRQDVIDARLDQRSPQRADRIAVGVLGFERVLVIGRRQPGQDLLERAVVDCRFRLLHDFPRPSFLLAGSDDAFGWLRLLE